ncbi:MAG: hypothetical protein MR616_10450, partial [Pyramidobacter sp.]|nr:hypothetical protein [Pyramidobacter sp.]
LRSVFFRQKDAVSPARCFIIDERSAAAQTSDFSGREIASFQQRPNRLLYQRIVKYSFTVFSRYSLFIKEETP